MNHKTLIGAVVVSAFFISHSALGFEGRIRAVIRRSNQTTPLLYTVGTNFLRIEVTATDRPHPVDILDLNSGELTLLFPHNRSFVRLNSSGTGVPSVRFDEGRASGNPQLAGGTPAPLPAVPPPAGIGPTNLPGMPAGVPPGVAPQPVPFGAPPNGAGGPPALPAMPMMPMPQEKMELQATDDTTNLLGYACTRYELKQRGETMEIWATDQLFPFQPYVQNQPHRFGPRMMEEQWGGMLKAKKLFPLLATLKFGNGVKRYRFEVQSIMPEKLTATDAKLFQPPTNYFEIRPLPF
jgi:Domain of unknown function (DUF4412)